jgi:hypothetical protein
MRMPRCQPWPGTPLWAAAQAQHKLMRWHQVAGHNQPAESRGRGKDVLSCNHIAVAIFRGLAGMQLLSKQRRAAWFTCGNVTPGNRSEIMPSNSGMSCCRNFGKLTSRRALSSSCSSHSSGRARLRLPAVVQGAHSFSKRAFQGICAHMHAHATPLSSHTLSMQNNVYQVHKHA